MALPAFWGGENLVGVRYIRRCGAVDVACDHTTEKIPDPVRSPQSSSVGLAEYCGGRPHGNGQCCRPFFFLFLFASFSGSLSLVLLFRSTCSTFGVIAYAMPIVSLRMTRSSYSSESLAGWHLKCASTRYCCVSFSFPRFFFFLISSSPPPPHTHTPVAIRSSHDESKVCIQFSLVLSVPVAVQPTVSLPCSALPGPCSALLCLALGLAVPCLGPCSAFPCLALPLALPLVLPLALLTVPCPALRCNALPCAAPRCPTLPCPALPCPALPCPALHCPALPYPTLPCPTLPCPALASPCPCPVYLSLLCYFVCLRSLL